MRMIIKKIGLIVCAIAVFSLSYVGNVSAKNVEKTVSQDSVDNMNASLMMMCNQHIFEVRRVPSHNRLSNGGCTMSLYEFERCSKCGYTTPRKVISTLAYKKCTHK